MDARGLLRRLKDGPGGRGLLEARLRADMLRGPRGGPRVLFLTSQGRGQSSLLRCWLIADELRRLGWAAACVPDRLGLAQRRRAIRAFRPDLVYVQKSHHPLNDPAHLEGLPLVYDLDDADFHDDRLAPRIDLICRRARGVVAGSRYVAEWCAARNAHVGVVWTCVPVSDGARPPQAGRAPILVWGQASPELYPAEFAFLEGVLLAARARGAAFRLRVHGWPEPDASARTARLRAAGIEVENLPYLGYDAFLRSLREAAIGLSPIDAEARVWMRGKSFGKVLAYLDAGVPTIAADAADNAAFFDGRNGVVSNDPEVWVETILRLLASPEARQRMADSGLEGLRARFSMEIGGRLVDAFLRECLKRGPGGVPLSAPGSRPAAGGAPPAGRAG